MPVSQSCSLKPIDGEVPEDERATSVMPSVAERYSSAVPFWVASARNTISIRAELRGRRLVLKDKASEIHDGAARDHFRDEWVGISMTCHAGLS